MRTQAECISPALQLYMHAGAHFFHRHLAVAAAGMAVPWPWVRCCLTEQKPAQQHEAHEDDRAGQVQAHLHVEPSARLSFDGTPL